MNSVFILLQALNNRNCFDAPEITRPIHFSPLGRSNSQSDYGEEEAEGNRGSLEDHPIVREARDLSFAAFCHVREFANDTELAEISNDRFALNAQSLLIRLRILGPDHPDTIYFIR